jgi:hypothetical protein
MIIFLVEFAAILLAPVLISVAYAFAWPRVYHRPVLFSVVGSFAGLAFACVALYWVTLPLQYIGISGSSSSGPTPDQMFAPRAFVGLLFVAVATVVSLWIIARIIGRGAASS